MDQTTFSCPFRSIHLGHAKEKGSLKTCFLPGLRGPDPAHFLYSQKVSKELLKGRGISISPFP